MFKSEKFKKAHKKLKWVQTKSINIKIDDKKYRCKPGFCLQEQLYSEKANSKCLFLNILNEAPYGKHNAIEIDILGYFAAGALECKCSNFKFNDRTNSIRFIYKDAYLNRKENRWKKYTQKVEIFFDLANEYVEFKNILQTYLKPKSKGSEVYVSKKYVRVKGF